MPREFQLMIGRRGSNRTLCPGGLLPDSWYRCHCSFLPAYTVLTRQKSLRRRGGGVDGPAGAGGAGVVDAGLSILNSGTISGGGSANALLFTGGNNTLTLNGVNTYTGGTTVSAGTLAVGDAAHPSASIMGDVRVDGAGTPRGHGTGPGQRSAGRVRVDLLLRSGRLIVVLPVGKSVSRGLAVRRY